MAMLLNHSSGVRNYTSAGFFREGRARLDLDTAQIVDSFKDRAVDFAPGAGWSCNNSGYVLVGAVIEAITGRPWWQGLSALQVPVFHPSQPGGIPGLASGHALGPGGVSDPAWPISLVQAHAAGALAADLQSLWRWNRQLHVDGFLRPATYRRMTTPEGAAVGPSYGYGLGIAELRGERRILHGGSTPGNFNAELLYLPAARVTVAVLRNADGGTPLARLALPLAAYTAGRPFPTPKPIEMDAAQLKQFEGVYGEGGQQRRVHLLDGVLTSQRGGDVAALVPVGPARFAYPWVEQVVFERGASGRVTGLRFFFDGDGEGTYHARTGDVP